MESGKQPLLVPWVWELLGHLDFTLQLGLHWELVLWAFGKGEIWGNTFQN